MRWQAKPEIDPAEWHRWWAWRPVIVDGQWVWGERIERRSLLALQCREPHSHDAKFVYTHGFRDWEYRHVQPSPTQQG